MDGEAAEMLVSASLPSHEDLTPKEQAVLEEYERLAENMSKVRPTAALCCGNVFANSTAGQAPGRSGWPTGDRDTRRPSGVGAQDESRVYAAQGECVQHCAAARD